MTQPVSLQLRTSYTLFVSCPSCSALVLLCPSDVAQGPCGGRSYITPVFGFPHVCWQDVVHVQLKEP